MIGESDQVTLQALVRRDGIDEVREAVARAHAEVVGWRVMREGETYGVIEPNGDIGAGTYATYGDAWAAVIGRMGYARERLPMPDSAYLVCVGTPVDGFGFTGPFAGRDEASAWIDRHGHHLDGDWCIAPLALPGAADPPPPDLATALRNLLTDIENTHVPTHIAETSQGISGAVDEANQALIAAGYEPVEVTWRDG